MNNISIISVKISYLFLASDVLDIAIEVPELKGHENFERPMQNAAACTHIYIGPCLYSICLSTYSGDCAWFLSFVTWYASLSCNILHDAYGY